MRRTSKTARRRWCALVGTVTMLCMVPSVGHSWKPYTHNTSALAAYWDAVDDGFMTIGGSSYAVAPGVAVALARWPEYYNAGVIGPDGFPDLTYGQSVIHPGAAERDAPESRATGEWLRHVLKQALAAQTDSTYTTDERQQILAFAYGYLTHAAGDMWGHSFINDFARGVFPGVGEILTSPEAAGIAARHIIAEGYVGDATPGFDADRNTRETLPGGDVSDDSTPGFAYDAPHRFVYETLIRTGADTPSTARGPIIDFFLDLRSGLDVAVTGTPPILSAALQLHREAQLARDAVSEACDFDTEEDIVDCPAALVVYGGISFAEFLTKSAAEIEALAQDVLRAYLVAWKEDIDTGLRNWSKFGLATTKGLFDAQTRRTLQNAACTQYPDESTDLRAECEAAIGLVETVLASAEPFILSDLLSMAGLPDAVGDLATILKTVMSTLQPIFNALQLPFNPVNEVALVVRKKVEDLIADAVAKVLGVDVRTLQQFLTQPHRFTCLEEAEIALPGDLGTLVLEMFRTGDHHRLDGLIGVPDDHHLPVDPLPLECGPLPDAATFELAQFKAMQNTITTAKLLLLDPAELNRLLGVTLGRQISTYVASEDNPEPVNVMVQQYGGAHSWLRSIDADHGWRHDGLPRFCTEGGVCPPADAPQADPRPAWLNGGAGSFPIWESCVLRPAFRGLFLDWETAGGSFPDLGDPASADLDNDPNAPQSFLGFSGRYFLGSNGQSYVAEDHAFQHTAADFPADKAFAASGLRLRRRVTLGVPGTDDPYTAGSQNDVFTLGTVDGSYQIDLQAADPCHGWASAFPGSPPPEITTANVLSSTYVLDTTAPVISCVSPPFGRQFDTDDTVTVDYDISDGAIGSGVASSSATVDGYSTLPGVVSTADNASLDLSQFYPGTRTVAIASADNLQHSSSLNCTFLVRATAASLQTNVQVARKQGLIGSDTLMNSLLDTLRVAERQHRRGQHSTEWNALEAFISQLIAQSGKGVDPTLASRLIAFARDIIANRG